ncbi:MFS transporter [Niallia taxi]|uniref:MFS transporter n=1 Tax=Niallia taxi TaxID=2499688 RepID=UPI002AA57204
MLNLLKKNNGAIFLLMLNVFLAFIGMGLVIPVMPTFMNMFGLSGTIVGLLVAAFAFSEFLFSPFAGRWADCYGRKKIIVFGLILFSISELIFGLASETLFLFIGRLLGGIGAGLIMPAVMAYVVDITTEKERGIGMGWISAAISTGFIIGPAIGGYLVTWGVRVPFFAAAVAALIAAVVTSFVLPESLGKEQQIENQKISYDNQLKELIISYRTPYFIGLMVILVASLGIAQYETVLGLFVDKKLAFTAQDIATMIMIGSIVGAIVQFTLFGLLVNKLGEKKLAIYALLSSGLFMLVSITFTNFWLLVIAVAIIFTSFDLVRPAISTFFSKIAGNEQGYVAGLNSAYTSLGYILGPILAGILFDIHLNIPFIFGSLIMFCGCLVLVTGRRGNQIK